MVKRLEGKVAVITGGASGMGRATANLFAEEGASVVVADIQVDKKDAIERELGARGRFIGCDVSREADVSGAVDFAVAEFGSLDIMFHCAGVGGSRAALDEITQHQWDETQNLLLRSSVFCIKHATPALRRKGGGSIILTSSVAALNLGDGIGAAAYIVAKAGVLTLCRVAALELADSRIRVNAIVPGFFPTPLVGDAVGAPKLVADKMGSHLHEAASRMQPLPQAGDPKDIAQAALFLASDESTFITGADLKVDGGLALHRKASSASVFKDFQLARERAEEDVDRGSAD